MLNITLALRPYVQGRRNGLLHTIFYMGLVLVHGMDNIPSMQVSTYTLDLFGVLKDCSSGIVVHIPKVVNDSKMLFPSLTSETSTTPCQLRILDTWLSLCHCAVFILTCSWLVDK